MKVLVLLATAKLYAQENRALHFYGCDALRIMSLATNEDVVLAVVGENVFKISDSVSNEEDITLTLGLSNSDNVVDNTLCILYVLEPAGAVV